MSMKMGVPVADIFWQNKGIEAKRMKTPVSIFFGRQQL